MRDTYYHRRFIGAVIAAVLLMTPICIPEAMAQGIVVIANQDVPPSSLSPSDIKKIFLGKKHQWENGARIAFALWADGEAKKTFLKQYTKKSPSQYTNFWKKLVFTGKGQMPASYNSAEEVVNFVGSTPGSIAFAAAGVSGDKIKIMEIK